MTSVVKARQSVVAWEGRSWTCARREWSSTATWAYVQPALRLRLDAVLEDAFADVPEAAQLFDIQVHQLAGRGVLIPIRRRPGHSLCTRQAMPPKYPPDRRRRPAK